MEWERGWGMAGDNHNEMHILRIDSPIAFMFKVPPFWPDLAFIALLHAGAFCDSVTLSF